MKIKFSLSYNKMKNIKSKYHFIFEREMIFRLKDAVR